MELRDIEIKQREERTQKFVERYGETLWHYTDTNAMDGIINKKEIWFGCTDSMNDKTELSGFIADLKRAVFAEVTEENREKAESVFETIDSRLVTEYPFVFCVSRAHDDAAQWERYAHEGQGVAIVFSTEWLYKLIFYNHIVMSKEYYVYNAKQHQLKDLLVDYIEENKMDAFSSLNGLIDNLLLCAMIHKHESFIAEQEMRLSPYFVKEDDPHLQYKLMGTIRKMYILDLQELCKKENIPLEKLIDSIVIGPRSKQGIEDLKWYCKKIGHPQLAERIRKSDCPLW